MKRTFRYYLKPTASQRQKLDQTLELCCWFHNFLLEQFRERDKRGEKQFTKKELQDLLPEIKKRHLFLKEVHSQSLQEVAKSVYKNWQKYKELKKLDNKKGHPKFKSVHRYNSFVYTQPVDKVGCGYKINNSPLNQKKEIRKLEISLGRQNNKNIQIETKTTMERNIEGKIKSLTIKRKNGRYYACFSCDEIQPNPLPPTNKSIGIDVNLNKSSYITLSTGKKYKHPQFYKKIEEKLKSRNKALSRKQKGSQNWLDAKLQLAKKWEKVVNQSKYYSRQVANELVKDYDNIAIEDLKIRNMVRQRTLAKSIQQARWGILFKVISEAAEIATRGLVRVNPRNTSQTCSDCGELLKNKLTLNQRMFRCEACKLELDRDVNSARNVLNRAIVENRFDQNLPLNKEKNYSLVSRL